MMVRWCMQTAEQAAKITDIEASLARRFAQSQQLLVDELELGRDQSIIDTTRNQQQALQVCMHSLTATLFFFFVA